MRLVRLGISHFKSIRKVVLEDIENALILVGQNNTGKTTVLDAIRAVGGGYQIQQEDFDESGSNIREMVKSADIEEWMRGWMTFAGSCLLIRMAHLSLPS